MSDLVRRVMDSITPVRREQRVQSAADFRKDEERFDAFSSRAKSELEALTHAVNLQVTYDTLPDLMEMKKLEQQVTIAEQRMNAYERLQLLKERQRQLEYRQSLDGLAAQHGLTVEELKARLAQPLNGRI